MNRFALSDKKYELIFGKEALDDRISFRKQLKKVKEE